METNMLDWSNAHAHLWTSFKKSQELDNANKKERDVNVDNVVSNDSLYGSCTIPVSEVASLVLGEVMMSKDPSEPVFSKELERQIDSLIVERSTIPAIRDLLVTVMHLKNRTEKMAAENAYRQESLGGMAEEVMLHLNGSGPDSGDEAITERNGAIVKLEDRMCRILIEVEKSKELVRKLSELVFNFTLPSSSSIREMLEVLCTSSKSHSSLHRGRVGDSDVEVISGTETLEQVMDILGVSVGTDLNDAPDRALHLVKDLELLRRENHAQAVLLHQYEKTALGVFSSYGVASPPTVEQVRELLRSSGDAEADGCGDLGPNASGIRGNRTISPNPPCSSDIPWSALDLQELIAAMVGVSESCFLSPAPQWIREGPASRSADDVLNYLRGSISAARELLLILARNEMDTRTILGKIFLGISRWNADLHPNNGQDDNLGNITFKPERPLLVIARELEKIVDLVTQQQQQRQDEQSSVENLRVQREKSFSDNLPPETSPVETSGLSGRLNDALLRIVRLFPKDYLTDFSPPVGSVREEAMCQCIENAVRHLAESRAVIIDRTASLLEKLQLDVSSLNDSPACSAVQARIFDSVAAGWNCLSEFRADKLQINTNSGTADDDVVRAALHELAQLLPTGTPANAAVESVAIDPPVNNLLDMVRLVRHRQEQWLQAQKRQKVSGAQSRLDRARLEESVQNRSQRLLRLTQEILHPGSCPNETEAPNTVGEAVTELNEHTKKSPSAMELFDELEERLRVVKSRHHKLTQSHAADRVRLENLTQFSTAHVRRWSRICGAVAAVCRLVGMDSTAERLESLERSSKSESGDPQANLQFSQATTALRQDQHKSTVPPPVGDTDILDALRLVEERLRQDDALRSGALVQSYKAQLEEVKRSWGKEASTFRQAIEMIVLRLAEAGRRVKQVLFMLGTDETPEDNLLEDILSEHRRRAEEEEDKQRDATGTENERDRENAQQTQGKLSEDGDHEINGDAGDEEQQKTDIEMQRRQETDEEALATLLQKFSRWATRLHETTEDHLYAQQKISKYFAAVHRFFCHIPAGSSTENSEPEENLIDIDATLMRFTDDILPALDRAITAAQSLQAKSENNTNIDNEPGGNSDDKEKSMQAQMLALTMMLQGTPRDRVLMADHRLVRLYEALARLRTMVAGLLSVRYLAIPSAVRSRRSNGDDDLIFDDAWGENEYVELDFMKLSSSNEGGAGTSSINDDVLVRALETNLSTIYQALGKFSTNYKLAAILVQKDTDAMQQFITEMLEPYVELDVEQAFGQDATALGEMLALLRDRATRQRGCYFFSRVAGEGPCVWAVALEQLSIGFTGILAKLRRRTKIAAEVRDMLDDVVDLCAIYANWVELSGAAAIHPFPEDVLESCVREDKDALSNREGGSDEDKVEAVENGKRRANSGLKSEQKESKGLTAPKPPLPPQAMTKISHFTNDAVLLKVMAHMLQLAQLAVGTRDERQQQQQMEEQLQVVRETAAVAAQRVTRVEAERDSAQSEAAVCRAELRRWKRLYGIVEEKSPPALTGAPVHDLQNTASGQEQGSVHAGNRNNNPNGEAEGLLLEVARSVRELTAELRTASHRTNACPPPPPPRSTSPSPPPPPPDTVCSTPPAPEPLIKNSTNNAKPKVHSNAKLSGKPVHGSNAKATVAARASWGRTSAHSAGLVVSPNGSSRARSFSPPSSASSLPASSVMPAALATGGSVSYGTIAPASMTYTDISKGRYRPNDHRGGFFDICEVCTRRHHGSLCPQDQQTRSRQGKENLMKHRNASPNCRTSPSSLQRARSQIRISSPSLASQRRTASVNSGRMKKDAFLQHQLHLETQKKEQKEQQQDIYRRPHNLTSSDKNNDLRRVGRKAEPLLSLSTAEVLAPSEHNEQNNKNNDEPIYMHTNYSHKRPVQVSSHSAPMRTRSIGRTSRSNALGKEAFGTPHHVFEQHGANPSRDGCHSAENRRHSSRTETPVRTRGSRQNADLQSDALRKLADIVAKTKLTGREDL